MCCIEEREKRDQPRQISNYNTKKRRGERERCCRKHYTLFTNFFLDAVHRGIRHMSRHYSNHWVDTIQIITLSSQSDSDTLHSIIRRLTTPQPHPQGDADTIPRVIRHIISHYSHYYTPFTGLFTGWFDTWFDTIPIFTPYPQGDSADSPYSQGDLVASSYPQGDSVAAPYSEGASASGEAPCE